MDAGKIRFSFIYQDDNMNSFKRKKFNFFI